jgi:hypothetical protein
LGPDGLWFAVLTRLDHTAADVTAVLAQAYGLPLTGGRDRARAVLVDESGFALDGGVSLAERRVRSEARLALRRA